MGIILEQSYTAVVRSSDGVQLEISAASHEERTGQLIDFIVARYRFTLWPADAERVQGLLDARRLDDAVSAYFDAVGERWDEERLELRL